LTSTFQQGSELPREVCNRWKTDDDSSRDAGSVVVRQPAPMAFGPRDSSMWNRNMGVFGCETPVAGRNQGRPEFGSDANWRLIPWK
jgi:hypothetical protein